MFLDAFVSKDEEDRYRFKFVEELSDQYITDG